MKKLVTILEENGWITIMKNYFGRCSGYKVHFKKCDGFNKNCDFESSKNEARPSQGMRPINTNNKEVKDYQEDSAWNQELLNN